MQRIYHKNAIFPSVQKLIKKLPITIFLVLHFSFLILAIIENRNNLYSVLILSGIAFLLSVFYIKNFNSDKSRFKKTDVLLVLFTAIGATITYWLNIKFGMGAVLAAAFTGLISSIIPFLNRKSDILRELPVAMYCGAFAGMTAPFIANGYSFIILSGLFSGLILISSKDTLHGYGGKLGSIAFGGVSMMSLILFLFS